MLPVLGAVLEDWHIHCWSQLSFAVLPFFAMSFPKEDFDAARMHLLPPNGYTLYAIEMVDRGEHNVSGN
jgi:hypothetical protein